MVCLTQTMHLSYTNTNTISKWTEMRFDRTHITYEFHWVHPYRFLSIYYVQPKPCTDIASRLALSPNGLKWATTWASSPRIIIGCVQNDIWPYSTFGTSYAPIFALTLTPSTNGPKQDSNPRHLGVPSGLSKTISKLWYVSQKKVYLSCVKISTISIQIETSF
jgi:hypothetical protein